MTKINLNLIKIDFRRSYFRVMILFINKDYHILIFFFYISENLELYQFIIFLILDLTNFILFPSISPSYQIFNIFLLIFGDQVEIRDHGQYKSILKEFSIRTDLFSVREHTITN